MARKSPLNYKPPFLMIRYKENPQTITETEEVQTITVPAISSQKGNIEILNGVANKSDIKSITNGKCACAYSC